MIAAFNDDFWRGVLDMFERANGRRTCNWQECGQCGARFLNYNRPPNKFCSRDCAGENSADQNRGRSTSGRRPAEKPIQVCQWCRASFPSAVPRKFCSRQCYGEHISARHDERTT